MFNPHLLRSFSALIQAGSFTRAADRLGITQAAVSQHIRQLEQQTGTLMLRGKRTLELTPQGIALREYCLELEQANKRLMHRLDDKAHHGGEISVISPGSIGLRIYPLLLNLQQARPELSIRYRFAPDHTVITAIAENRFELGLVTQQPDDTRLVADKFTEEPLELLLPAGFALNNWQDLHTLGFINHPDGNAMATRLLSRRFPGNPGIHTLPVSGFINHIGLIAEPVARGLGFTVLPRYARLAYPRQALLQVDSDPVHVVDTLWLIHRAEWPLTRRAEEALAWLRQHLAQEGNVPLTVSSAIYR
ncbi:LysR family transcriptional regulator [Kosakonia sp. LAM2021]|uniref:LysR family transcriptional regulator n=1 Tax=Kosakonia sp. LAM2021 TaxID=2800475 RepID=UPI001909068F|nr:LysR family transcriptional regulator [Kosakonia sp. LAM2021]